MSRLSNPLVVSFDAVALLLFSGCAQILGDFGSDPGAGDATAPGDGAVGREASFDAGAPARDALAEGSLGEDAAAPLDGGDNDARVGGAVLDGA